MIRKGEIYSVEMFEGENFIGLCSIEALDSGVGLGNCIYAKWGKEVKGKGNWKNDLKVNPMEDDDAGIFFIFHGLREETSLPFKKKEKTSLRSLRRYMDESAAWITKGPDLEKSDMGLNFWIPLKFWYMLMSNDMYPNKFRSGSMWSIPASSNIWISYAHKICIFF